MKNKLLELEKELNEQKPSKNRVIEIRRELDELRLQEAQITSDSVKSATESEDRLKYLQEIVPKLMEKGWTVKGENGKRSYYSLNSKDIRITMIEKSIMKMVNNVQIMLN